MPCCLLGCKLITLPTVEKNKKNWIKQFWFRSMDLRFYLFQNFLVKIDKGNDFEKFPIKKEPVMTDPFDVLQLNIDNNILI